jgi:hypothetical protein
LKKPSSIPSDGEARSVHIEAFAAAVGEDKVKALATAERPVYEVGVRMAPSATEAMQSAGDRDDKGYPSNSKFEALAWRRKIRLGKALVQRIDNHVPVRDQIPLAIFAPEEARSLSEPGRH